MSQDNISAEASISPSSSNAEKVPNGGRRFKQLINRSESLERCVEQDRLMRRIAHELVPHSSMAKKILSEFVGTFILLFAAAGTGIVNEKTHGDLTIMGVAAGSGIAVMVIIFSTGHISGAHLNPSVTLAFASMRHFPWIQVPVYIAAQVLASVLASLMLTQVFHPKHFHGGMTSPAASDGQAFLLEFLISFILMFVVTAVATDTRAVGELAGIAVGATVFLNNLIASKFTGASMNPVRTLGPAIAANDYHKVWIYIVAPTLGTQAGALTYNLMRLKDMDSGTSMRSFRKWNADLEDQKNVQSQY
ncbi:hypothetical protein O6H91_12G083600 [Diphasiastrum complanatum]|uniref:Uncharacterized protein n=1 Tax=Diphasiastrum complanatum TaxID=34168 RepID=A0ACC2C4C7_DIPCM|nr:hypothetical protein O6H91_12G083600 [Diphasiastrum complanatum]